MKVSIEIPESVYKELREKAQRKRRTIKSLVIQSILAILKDKSAARRRV